MKSRLDGWARHGTHTSRLRALLKSNVHALVYCLDTKPLGVLWSHPTTLRLMARRNGRTKLLGLSLLRLLRLLNRHDIRLWRLLRQCHVRWRKPSIL